jgi:hypothetical protein
MVGGRTAVRQMGKWATGRTVLILFVLTLMLAAVLMIPPIGTPAIEVLAGVTLLEGRMGYTSAEAYEVIGAIAERARMEYTRFLFVDFVFITVYGAFFAFTLFYLTRQLFPAVQHGANIAGLGLLAALVDYLEGVLFLTMLSRYPSQAVTAASIAGTLTTLKLLLFYLCLALVLTGLAAWQVLHFSKRQTNSTV